MATGGLGSGTRKSTLGARTSGHAGRAATLTELGSTTHAATEEWQEREMGCDASRVSTRRNLWWGGGVTQLMEGRAGGGWLRQALCRARETQLWAKGRWATSALRCAGVNSWLLKLFWDRHSRRLFPSFAPSQVECRWDMTWSECGTRQTGTKWPLWTPRGRIEDKDVWPTSCRLRGSRRQHLLLMKHLWLRSRPHRSPLGPCLVSLPTGLCCLVGRRGVRPRAIERDERTTG